MAETLVNTVNGKELYAKRAVSTQSGANIDDALSEKQRQLTDVSDILVVNALPASPEPNILYLVTEGADFVSTAISNGSFSTEADALTATEIAQGFRDISIPLVSACYSDHVHIAFTLTGISLVDAVPSGSQSLGLLPELYLGNSSEPTKFLIRKINSTLYTDTDDTGRTIEQSVLDADTACPVWNFDFLGRSSHTVCDRLTLRLNLDTGTKTFYATTTIQASGSFWELLPPTSVLRPST